MPPDSTDLTTAIISKHSNPAAEIGGDARLLLPSQNQIKSEELDIEGQVQGHLPLSLRCPQSSSESNVQGDLPQQQPVLVMHKEADGPGG